MPPLSSRDLRRLASEIEASGADGIEIELVSEADEREKERFELDEEARYIRRLQRLRLSAWLDVGSLAGIGCGGIMVSVLTNPGTTAHEWSIAVGAPAIMSAGGLALRRLKGLIG